MKHAKMLSLAAITAAALMAFVGASSASATTLTGEGGAVLGAGTTIHATNEGITTLTTAFKNIECEESTVLGKTENSGGVDKEGKDVPVTGKIETLTFGKCNCEVKVISNGSLSVSGAGSNNGTLSSSGAEVTASCSTLFGNVHCIYATNNTVLGTATGSANTGGTATMDISSANIPRLSTSALCAEKANWDAKYVVDNPDVLNIDVG